MTAKTANQVFSSIYDAIQVEMGFQPQWANNTGYLDGLVRHEFDLPVGTMFKTFTGKVNKRRVIVIIMPEGVGNVVVFDRFTDAKGEVFVHNMPTVVSQLFGYHSDLSAAQLDFIFGDVYYVGKDHGENLGYRMERFYDDIVRRSSMFTALSTKREQKLSRVTRLS